LSLLYLLVCIIWFYYRFDIQYSI